jgi:coenzyme PQQ biosynthesis protein PqqD
VIANDGAGYPDLRDRFCLAAGVRLHEDRYAGSTVLLRPEGVVQLNDTGRAIIVLCDGCATVGDIVAAMAEAHDAPANVVRADVTEFLRRLIVQRLIRLVPTAEAAR